MAGKTLADLPLLSTVNDGDKILIRNNSVDKRTSIINVRQHATKISLFSDISSSLVGADYILIKQSGSTFSRKTTLTNLQNFILDFDILSTLSSPAKTHNIAVDNGSTTQKTTLDNICELFLTSPLIQDSKILSSSQLNIRNSDDTAYQDIFFKNANADGIYAGGSVIGANGLVEVKLSDDSEYTKIYPYRITLYRGISYIDQSKVGGFIKFRTSLSSARDTEAMLINPSGHIYPRNMLILTDANGVFHNFADKNSGETHGIVLRPNTNPPDGEPIFQVESSGNSQRLRVEHQGDVYSANSFNTTKGYKVSGTTVIDSSRNAGFNSLAVGDTEVIDSSRNAIHFNHLNASIIDFDLDEISNGTFNASLKIHQPYKYYSFSLDDTWSYLTGKTTDDFYICWSNADVYIEIQDEGGTWRGLNVCTLNASVLPFGSGYTRIKAFNASDSAVIELIRITL